VQPPQIGEVIPYSYLWARERNDGEESGRKVRPCVVVVAVQPAGKNTTLVVVAPVTSQAPTDDGAVQMPRAVKTALNLDASPSWVICNEVNQFVWPGFDLGQTPNGARSYGRIPGSLLQKIRAEIVTMRATSVSRDE
jgi:uncharacterized protein YifN (PemK superfamily)